MVEAMAYANLAGGAGAYLALLHARQPTEIIVHQAVMARTLELWRDREEALAKLIGAHVGNAVGRVMGKVFGG